LPASGLTPSQASSPSAYANSLDGSHAGRRISEVVRDLRSGVISPDALAIDYVIRNGQAITLNNRSLLALIRARLNPTIAHNLTGNLKAEKLLNKHLRGGSPSSFIQVRGGLHETSLIE
jgi:hypothetical protein